MFKTSAFAEVLDVLVWGIEPPLETLGGSGVCVVCAAKWQCGGVETVLVCRFSRNLWHGLDTLMQERSCLPARLTGKRPRPDSQTWGIMPTSIFA